MQPSVTAPFVRKPLLGCVICALILSLTSLCVSRDFYVPTQHGTTLSLSLQNSTTYRHHSSYQRDFEDSNIGTFLEAVDEVTRRRDRQLMFVCGPGFLCGGIADRMRALPFLVSLALLSDRQLIIHATILSKAESIEGFSSDFHYYLVDGHCTTENARILLDDQSPMLYVTSNCQSFDHLAFSASHSSASASLDAIWRECAMPLSYLCGAAVVHRLEIFQQQLADAYRVICALDFLPERGYDVIHIRAGGSSIDVGGTQTFAVPWPDGHATSLPQVWVDAFQRSNFTNCKKAVALVSDSSRVISEIRWVVDDRIMIANCCFQALHRDRSNQKDFFFQEVLDLFIMARARRVYSVVGGFSILGQYWLGKDGPALFTPGSEREINDAMNDILSESGCDKKLY
jgi:hypothetical protein